MNEELRRRIGKLLDAQKLEASPVSGGSINSAWHINADGRQYFCKINSATRLPGLFENEVRGLRLLAATDLIATPGQLQHFQWQDYQVLLMEWVEPGVANESFWKSFGRQLAQLHLVKSNRCGLDHDNYLGSIPQINRFSSSWVDFFRRQRLEYMVERNRKKGRLDSDHADAFEKLYARLPVIFEEEALSLLHGDLWSGNFLVNRHSLPVLIDPAVYYGHRCMDLGMTQLFGGFDPAFYESYDHHYPLSPHHEEQSEVCSLYPLLIHLELFGRSYLGQIEAILKRYN